MDTGCAMVLLFYRAELEAYWRIVWKKVEIAVLKPVFSVKLDGRAAMSCLPQSFLISFLVILFSDMGSKWSSNMVFHVFCIIFGWFSYIFSKKGVQLDQLWLCYGGRATFVQKGGRGANRMET
jgi:hypothetical protein